MRLSDYWLRKTKRSVPYELQPAPGFLFERRPLTRPCVDRTPGSRDRDLKAGEAFVVYSGELPFRLTRRDEVVVTRSQAPTLTITSDPYNSIAVFGSDVPHWAVSLCSGGEGHTEAEARARLQEIVLSVAGSAVALTCPGLYDGLNRSGHLVVEGPSDAGVVIHGSYSSVDVRDLAGPVRIAATHARATVLDTTGQLDVTARCVDFAGAGGRVTLSADGEINLKMTAQRFTGTLLAWSQRAVRMLVPPGFMTPFEAVVSRREHFVCRAEFSSQVTLKRQGELYIFTHGTAAADRPPLHLRSESATVVIDTDGGGVAGPL
jgi:hypothetical protein